MKKRILSTIAIFIGFVLMVTSCVKDEEGTIIGVGDEVPFFSVTLSDGSSVSSESILGSPSVIVFFNTSCPDCRQELIAIQKVYDIYKSFVDFVVISRNEGDSSIQKYFASHDLTMPYSAQKDRSVYTLFAKSLIPRVYVSDNGGVVKFVHDDSPIASSDELKAELSSIMREGFEVEQR